MEVHQAPTHNSGERHFGSMSFGSLVMNRAILGLCCSVSWLKTWWQHGKDTEPNSYLLIFWSSTPSSSMWRRNIATSNMGIEAGRISHGYGTDTPLLWGGAWVALWGLVWMCPKAVATAEASIISALTFPLSIFQPCPLQYCNIKYTKERGAFIMSILLLITGYP